MFKRFSVVRAVILSAALLASLATVGMGQQTEPPASPAKSPPAVNPAPPPSPPKPSTDPDFATKMDRVAEQMAQVIARYHGESQWRQKAAIQTDLVVELHGKTALECTIT